MENKRSDRESFTSMRMNWFFQARKNVFAVQCFYVYTLWVAKRLSITKQILLKVCEFYKVNNWITWCYFVSGRSSGSVEREREIEVSSSKSRRGHNIHFLYKYPWKVMPYILHIKGKGHLVNLKPVGSATLKETRNYRQVSR